MGIISIYRNLKQDNYRGLSRISLITPCYDRNWSVCSYTTKHKHFAWELMKLWVFQNRFEKKKSKDFLKIPMVHKNVLRYVIYNLQYYSQKIILKNEVKYFNFNIQSYVLRYVLLNNNINLDHFQKQIPKMIWKNLNLDYFQKNNSKNDLT